MKIKHLRLGQRNNDGEFPVGVVLEFHNAGLLEARSVSVNAVLIDGGGFPIADTAETDTSVSVGSGERMEWMLTGWTVPEHLLGGSSAAAGARASGVLRGREVLRLGMRGDRLGGGGPAHGGAEVAAMALKHGAIAHEVGVA